MVGRRDNPRHPIVTVDITDRRLGLPSPPPRDERTDTATSSPDRCELYEMMRDAFGEPLATFIGRIPSMDSSDVATEQDVDNMAIQLRGEMVVLGGEMGGKIAGSRREPRDEIAELHRELRDEMAELHCELHGEMGHRRGAMLGQFSELRAEFQASSRHTGVTKFAAAVSIWLNFCLPNVL